MQANAASEAAATRLVGRATRAADGAESLDDDALKHVKRFARQSDAHVHAVFLATWEKLGAPDSLERFLALRVCAVLWQRSAAFRRALVDQLVPRFVQLVAGDFCDEPLPPPRRWAERLGREALQLLEAWQASHGHLDGYRPLGLALRYLKQRGATAASSAAQAPAPRSDAAATARSWRDRYEELAPQAPVRLS